MVKVEALVKEISGLSVLELAQLTKELESVFGVSATMMVGAAAPAAPAAGGADASSGKSDEKAEYKVEITDGGDNKIKVIKALRQVKKDLGLTEAKKMVEETPSVVADAVPTAEAKAMKEALEAAGAKVKLS